jgi:D-aminopeptidase
MDGAAIRSMSETVDATKAACAELHKRLDAVETAAQKQAESCSAHMVQTVERIHALEKALVAAEAKIGVLTTLTAATVEVQRGRSQPEVAT